MCAQSYPTPCDSMDGDLLGSSVDRISQARKLAWVAISFSRDQTHVSLHLLLHWQAGSLPAEPPGIGWGRSRTLVLLGQLGNCAPGRPAGKAALFTSLPPSQADNLETKFPGI